MYPLLYYKAEHLIQLTPLRYFDIMPFDIPNIAGVYIISLKEDDDTESYLSVNFTNNLRTDIFNKQVAFISTFKGNNIRFIKGKGPRFVEHSESLEYLKENCQLRYMVETDLKEQLALTAIVCSILKPWSNGN